MTRRGAAIGEKYCVAGGLGGLFDAGRDVDGVADRRELELPSATDGSRRSLRRYRSDANP
jgi:hypothetical protein